MIPEIKAEFILTGKQISPDEITRLLGMYPTRTWKEGDFIQETKLRRKHNGWCFSVSSDKNSLDLEDYISPILRALLPKSDTIKCVSDEYGLASELSCAIYIRDETPSINLGIETLTGLAKLVTTFDIDIILTRGK